MPDHLRFRPCVACRALVDPEVGCTHWRPNATRRAIELRRERHERHRAKRKDERKS